MARRLARYLEFFHAIPVKMFNVNEYRWKKYGKVENFFFDPNNDDSWKKREGIYDDINAEVVAFMQAHPNGVAILDSTNATFERRNKISSMIYSTGAKMMFVEVHAYVLCVHFCISRLSIYISCTNPFIHPLFLPNHHLRHYRYKVMMRQKLTEKLRRLFAIRLIMTACPERLQNPTSSAS